MGRDADIPGPFIAGCVFVLYLRNQAVRKASSADMSRFTPTLTDRIYMAVEALLDHHRRDGISEEQIRTVLDRAIIASRQLEATRALIKQPRR